MILIRKNDLDYEVWFLEGFSGRTCHRLDGSTFTSNVIYYSNSEPVFTEHIIMDNTLEKFSGDII